MYTTFETSLIMAYSLYVPNTDTWREHFLKGQTKQKSFYTINKSKKLGESLDAVKIVSPTEQMVEQAKSTLKRYHEEEELADHHPQKAIKRSKGGNKSHSKFSIRGNNIKTRS